MTNWMPQLLATICKKQGKKQPLTANSQRTQRIKNKEIRNKQRLFLCAKHIQSNAQERQTDRLKCQSVKIRFMGRPSGGNRFDSPMNLNLEPGTKP